ncbi:MAG: serine/threonine protein kinase [Verrucomicrobia bacterium]|nr:serine/threonine protein kinase [Verrucomicrobiota bacterium]
MNQTLNREVVVFNTAVQLPAAQRAAYLDEACQGEVELRRRVEALLQAHERAGGFLEDLPAGVAPPLSRGEPPGVSAAAREPATLAEKPGNRIGRYKLLQQIGEGGCGVVYMAEQEEPVRRRVALKVIKVGMDTRSVIARFEAERQALAMMDHPNIAKVLDAGATETGRPFFVMELVRGIKITDYCDQNSLPTPARLDLVIQICRAVQHAHQKGIIHRDLKPSNILVTVNDGVAVPKVIDFGIAKATQGRLTDQTFFTAFEQFLGTPAYMSPEQSVLTSVDIDTRSDIYSLGVLLYELLTGQTPFNQKELLAAGLDQMRRTICEKEPLRPSTRLRTMEAAALTAVARCRQSEPPKLIHLVRGDLDWIVMKCLEKNRARRYETANALAMDLTRHQRSEPVLARPYNTAYRTAKFVRRHRGSVTFASLILVALTSGLVGTITQARRATHNAALAETLRRRAEHEARAANEQRDFALRQLSRAEAINDLNSFLLSDAAPGGKPFTVGDLLARAERIIDRQSGETDENRVELLIAIGRQYENHDEHRKARELLGKAYALTRNSSEPALRAKATAAFANAIALAGEFERGERLVQEALGELSDSPPHTLPRVFCLLRGSHIARENGQAQLGIERVLVAQRLLRDSGQGSPLLDLTVAIDLAESHRMAGANRDAAAAFAEAYNQLVALGRDDTEKAGTLLNNWGVAVEVLGQPLEAERLYRRAIAISTAEGEEETVSPMLLNNLARTLVDLHRFAEAAEYAERADEKARRAGTENVVNMCLNVRAMIYRELGDLVRSGEVLAELEARWKRMLPTGHFAFAALASQQSLLILARGDVRAAVIEADRALAIAEAASDGHDRLPILLLRRANMRLHLDQVDAARADAARALALHQEATGQETLTGWSGRAYLVLGRALHAQGNLSEARAAYVFALEHLRASLGTDHPETREAAEKLRNSGQP